MTDSPTGATEAAMQVHLARAAAGPPEAAAATFTGLPPHKTLTLGMDVPEAW